MAELAMRQVDLVAAAGVSDTTVRSLQRARADEGYRDSTLQRIAAALEWRTDAFDRIARGLQPVPAATPPPDDTVDEAEMWRRMRDLQNQISVLMDAQASLRHIMDGILHEIKTLKREMVE